MLNKSLMGEQLYNFDETILNFKKLPNKKISLNNNNNNKNRSGF